MDTAYYNWLWLLGFGVLLGIFLSTRLVVILAAGCMAIAVTGLVISAAVSANSLTMLFGIAAMVVPVVGGVAAVGSLLGNAVRSTLMRAKQ
jgi:peptidoglycan/LPS O-acetylase OafA/YrhL